jgi:hypothetical protein
MKALTLLLVASAAFAADPDPREIVRQAIQNFEKDAQAELRYSYVQTDDKKSKGVTVSQVTIIQGTPYERVVSRNGQPISTEQEKKEQEKYEKAVSEREYETPEQRAKRLRSYAEDNKIFEEALDAFDFKLMPSDGSDYVLECTPRPGFQPHGMKAKIFTKVQATAWIDKRDVRLVKADATVIAPVSIGLFVARMSKGGHMLIEQKLIEESTWFPTHVAFSGKAKIMLVDSKQMDEQISYGDYRPIDKDQARHGGQTVAPFVPPGKR